MAVGVVVGAARDRLLVVVEHVVVLIEVARQRHAALAAGVIFPGQHGGGRLGGQTLRIRAHRAGLAGDGMRGVRQRFARLLPIAIAIAIAVTARVGAAVLLVAGVG